MERQIISFLLSEQIKDPICIARTEVERNVLYMEWRVASSCPCLRQQNALDLTCPCYWVLSVGLSRSPGSSNCSPCLSDLQDGCFHTFYTILFGPQITFNKQNRHFPSKLWPCGAINNLTVTNICIQIVKGMLHNSHLSIKPFISWNWCYDNYGTYLVWSEHH